jgi:hypothetical protein
MGAENKAMNEEELDVALLEKATLEKHLNSEFQIEVEEPDQAIVLELLEVSPFPDHRPEGEREGRAPFSAVFGCATHQVPQNSYMLTHPTLGRAVIFLTPIDNYKDGHKLEAVFS